MKFSHTQRRLNAAERCKRMVSNMLEWSELEYCQHQYEQGIQYLEYAMHGNDAVFADMERSAIYWGWWKNQFIIRDEEFLQRYDDLMKCGIELRRAAYSALHDGHKLASGEAEHALGVDKSFAKVIGMVHDEALKSKRIYAKEAK